MRALLAVIATLQTMDKYISELCEESADIKAIEERHATATEKLVKDVDIGELMDTLSMLEKERDELLDWDEGFEIMGYPKPTPGFDTSPQSE